MIVWAGTSSTDVGMVIEHYPKVIIPKRKIEVENVPGRNGDVVIETDSFENYDQQYSCFLDSKYIGGLEAVIPKVSDWLLGHSGYHRLEDSYFPDIYRMARFDGGGDFSSVFNEYGEGTLTFNCMPQKYLKNGEIEINCAAVNGVPKHMYNPTAFKAWPLVRFRVTKTVGQSTMSAASPAVIRFVTDGRTNDNNSRITICPTASELSGFTAANFILDTYEHSIYRINDNSTTKINASMWFSGKYEELYFGKDSYFTYNGFISNVTVIPRWWTI